MPHPPKRTVKPKPRVRGPPHPSKAASLTVTKIETNGEGGNVNNHPGHRAYHSCCLIHNKLVICAGTVNDAAVSGDLWYWDEETLEWTDGKLQLPTPVAGLTCSVYNKQILLFGGVDQHASPTDQLVCVELQEEGTSSLSTIVGRRKVGDVPVARGFHSTVEGGPLLYVFGGMICRKVDHPKPDETDHGTKGKEQEEKEKADREAAVIAEGRCNDYTNTLLVYSIEKQHWTAPPVTGNCPPARASHSAALATSEGPCMFVYGGRDQHNTIFDDLWCLQLEKMEWREIRDQKGITPGPRMAHRLCTVGLHIVLLGGHDKEEVADCVHTFNIEKGEWRKWPIDVKGSSVDTLKSADKDSEESNGSGAHVHESLSLKRYAHTAASAGDRILVYGGGIESPDWGIIHSGRSSCPQHELLDSLVQLQLPIGFSSSFFSSTASTATTSTLTTLPSETSLPLSPSPEVPSHVHVTAKCITANGNETILPTTDVAGDCTLETLRSILLKKSGLPPPLKIFYRGAAEKEIEICTEEDRLHSFNRYQKLHLYDHTTTLELTVKSGSNNHISNSTKQTGSPSRTTSSRSLQSQNPNTPPPGPSIVGGKRKPTKKGPIGKAREGSSSPHPTTSQVNSNSTKQSTHMHTYSQLFPSSHTPSPHGGTTESPPGSHHSNKTTPHNSPHHHSNSSGSPDSAYLTVPQQLFRTGSETQSVYTKFVHNFTGQVSLHTLPEVPDPGYTENDEEIPKMVDENGNALYKKMHEIGRGGFGKVYSALHKRSGWTMAYKEVETTGQNQNKEIAALEKEVNTMKILRHNHIVKYYGVRRTRNSLQICLEYCQGGSLRNLLKMTGKFSMACVKKYTTQILLGLRYLHSKRVLHRDIKAANILLADKGRIKLADFGASKHLEDIVYRASDHHSAIKGTALWMPPEVITSRMYSEASDVWSLGCTVIEMLTGNPPWAEKKFEGDIQALVHIGKGSESPPLPPGLSVWAEHFLQCCLSLRPELRVSVDLLLRHPFLHIHEAERSSSPNTPGSGVVDLNKTQSTTLSEEDLNSEQLGFFAYEPSLLTGSDEVPEHEKSQPSSISEHHQQLHQIQQQQQGYTSNSQSTHPSTSTGTSTTSLQHSPSTAPPHSTPYNNNSHQTFSPQNSLPSLPQLQPQELIPNPTHDSNLITSFNLAQRAHSDPSAVTPSLLHSHELQIQRSHSTTNISDINMIPTTIESPTTDGSHIEQQQPLRRLFHFQESQAVSMFLSPDSPPDAVHSPPQLLVEEGTEGSLTSNGSERWNSGGFAQHDQLHKTTSISSGTSLIQDDGQEPPFMGSGHSAQAPHEGASNGDPANTQQPLTAVDTQPINSIATTGRRVRGRGPRRK